MKQLTRFELAAVKRTVANIGGLVKKRTKLVEDIKALVEKVKAIDEEIEMWDAPIKAKWGESSIDILESNGVINDEPATVEGPKAADPEVESPANEIVMN